jgi:hypothetical protein
MLWNPQQSVLVFVLTANKITNRFCSDMKCHTKLYSLLAVRSHHINCFYDIFVDCRLMTRKSVLFIPNTTAIGLLHFFTFIYFCVKRFVPLIRSTSLFTRFLLGISSPGFMSPRRLNCRPARGLHLKTMWPTDFQIITPSGSVLKSIIYRWKEKGRPVRLPPWW